MSDSSKPAVLRVLGIQLAASPGDAAANRRRARALIEAHPGHDLYVLPELSSPGYDDAVLAAVGAHAEGDDDAAASCAFFADVARDVGAHVCFGYLRRAAGGVRICSAVAAPEGGVVLRYDKMHLCDMGRCSEVARGLAAGAAPGVFTCRGWRVGVAICYDLRFPELWRRLAWGAGCDVVVHPSAFARDATFPCYHPFATTRAVENQVYVLSVNFAGPAFGASVACPPWVGPVPGAADQAPAFLGDEEAVLPLACESAVLAAVRAAYPYRRDLHASLRGAAS